MQNLMVEDVATVSPDATLEEALRLIESRDYHALPVTRDGQHLDGIITLKDIWRAVREAGSFSGALGRKVSEFMTRRVVTVSPHDLVERAAKIMWDIQHPILPVVDDGELKGIIAESDIAKGFAEMLGVDEPGTTRFTLVVADRVGQLARLADIFADHNANITHVATYHSRLFNQYIMVVRALTDAPEPLRLDLERNGYKVLHMA